MAPPREGHRLPDPDLALIPCTDQQRYRLVAFQSHGIWAGTGGYPHHQSNAPEPYRARIAVWDHDGFLADLFFHDGATIPENSAPPPAARPYRIHFPVSVLEAVLHVLRQATKPVELVYYYCSGEKQWAVGVAGDEPVAATVRR